MHTSLQASTQVEKDDGALSAPRPAGQAGVSHERPAERPAERSGRRQVAEQGGGLAALDGDVWTRVDASATITSSFRYTEAELTALTDVLYEVGKQYGARVTKQDVARLALNAVLDDYHQRGPGSLLGQLAARRRRSTGGR
jgi:hypothetical protein